MTHFKNYVKNKQELGTWSIQVLIVHKYAIMQYVCIILLYGDTVNSGKLMQWMVFCKELSVMQSIVYTRFIFLTHYLFLWLITLKLFNIYIW